MRLIDADKFKQQIAATAIMDNLVTSKCNAMCKLIDSQPTAYDVEKIIEEIRNIPHGQILNVELENMIIGIIKSALIQ